MASAAPQTVRKNSKARPEILGRSRLTGGYILRPASSKGASITIDQAIAAWKVVASKTEQD